MSILSAASVENRISDLFNDYRNFGVNLANILSLAIVWKYKSTEKLFSVYLYKEELRLFVGNKKFSVTR